MICRVYTVVIGKFHLRLVLVLLYPYSLTHSHEALYPYPVFRGFWFPPLFDPGCTFSLSRPKYIITLLLYD
jgi:hypothetical protein